MLTVTCEPVVSEVARVTQNETLPSDLEISRRVLRIRSKWSVSERVRRRREAEQRFSDLVDKLVGEAA
jgi:predicted nucleic acid-binding protein